MSDDTEKRIGDMTPDEFLELVISKDEREILRRKIAEYDKLLADASAATRGSVALFQDLKLKTVSSPFTLRTAEEADNFVAGIKRSLASGVKEVILVLAT